MFMCAEGTSFWVELKVTKTNRVNISSHQVAWNYALYRAGGVSFFLVHPLSSPHLYLFGGDQGRGLVRHGLRTVCSGSTGTPSLVQCLWSGSDWSGLVGELVGISRSRVGIGVGSGSGPIGVGVGVGLGNGVGDHGRGIVGVGVGSVDDPIMSQEKSSPSQAKGKENLVGG